METSDLAMVSRIRVEVRGGTMEAAERVAFLVLDHAKMAGCLEGVVPSSGRYSDHFFHRPEVKGQAAAGAPVAPEPWAELGLPYEGRLSFSFDPSLAAGGEKQYGYEVTEVRDFRPYGLWGHPGSDEAPIREDVSERVMVLRRNREMAPVWETVSVVEASAEDVLDNIRRLVNFVNVEAKCVESGWVVKVEIGNPAAGGGWEYVEGSAATLRDAALDAYGRCGVEVTHFETVGGTEGGRLDVQVTESSGVSLPTSSAIDV